MSPSFPPVNDIPPSTPSVNDFPPQSNNPPSLNTESPPSDPQALALTLPPYEAIQSHTPSFYSLPASSPSSSLSAYQQSIRLVTHSVMRYTLFTAMKQCAHTLPLTTSLFSLYTRQGHHPAPTDVYPPLAWLERCGSPSVWTHCSIRVKREEWKKTKKVAIEPRFFLTAPSLSSTEKKDEASLYNALLLVISSSRYWFFRSLWHGCTANHLLEIAPISGVNASRFSDQSQLTVLHCGMVGTAVSLHDRSTWR